MRQNDRSSTSRAGRRGGVGRPQVTQGWSLPTSQYHQSKTDHLSAPRRLTSALLRLHNAVPTLWLLNLAALSGVQFWSYWRTLI